MTSTNFSDWYNATEGSVFWQGDTFADSVVTGVSNFCWAFLDGTVNNRMQETLSASGSDNVFRTLVRRVSVDQANYDITFSLTLNQTIKGSFAYKANDFASSVDGSAVATDTSGLVPTVNQAGLGYLINQAYLNGHIAKFYFWNTRKGNTFLQSITG